MGGSPPVLDLDLGTELAEVGRVLAAIDALHGSGALGGEAAFALRVAADEVLMNVIQHAHPGGGEHRVRVRLELVGARARLEISDDGQPFDPLAAPPPDTAASLAERSVGGLGIHLVRELMDEVYYQRSGDRNVLVMTKQLER